jgi:glycosyltransferase involved in cell wall biosynthesis
MISVVLASCDGERFIAAQLRSIAAQSQLPDELVVSDDASTDATLDVVRAFAADAPFEVRISSHRDRVGVPLNFSRAIGCAVGDTIVLADQDDVWVPDRLRRVSAALAQRQDAQAVFSDARIVDEAGQATGQRQWDVVGFSPRERHAFMPATFDPLAQQDVLARHNPVTGATMAFRSTLKPLLMPIDAGGYHDLWIAFLASATGGVVAIPEPLVDYRVHGGNLVGVRRPMLQRLQRRRAGLGLFGSERAQFVALRDRLTGAASEQFLVDPRTVEILDAKIAHLAFRDGLPRGRARRVTCATRELWRGGYRRYSRGVESWAFDAFVRSSGEQA